MHGLRKHVGKISKPHFCVAALFKDSREEEAVSNKIMRAKD